MTVNATKQRLGTILLIDDDAAHNYLHRRVIERSEVAEHVVVATDGDAAIEYLDTPVDGEYPAPDLIFLDLNMPRMTGWEFLQAYERLPNERRGNIVIVLLTTSSNPDDIERARQIEVVDGFRTKPLTSAMLLEIIADHFPGV